MERATLADTIRAITRHHLEQGGGMLLGQAVSAVGWVNHTVPDCQGIVELPMTDVAGAGIATGAALVGRRPIFVIRFQDFLILNGSPLIFYAAKAGELHGRPAPVFVRAIAAEGIGPVHSGVLHGVFMHFPGFRVSAPMTPGEYRAVWREFMDHEDPMICSEHRLAFARDQELPDRPARRPHITLYAISAARLQVDAAAERLAAAGVRASVVHLVRLKPLELDARLTAPLDDSGLGLVVDPGHTIAGAAQAVAQALAEATGKRVHALGIADRTKCLCPPLQNRTPDAGAICAAASGLLN